ncbi:MAG: hypothetical protein OXB93_04660 [Cytophagales bacterium]|nr:hypothetical protein [Cytophagales bacterium]
MSLMFQKYLPFIIDPKRIRSLFFSTMALGLVFFCHAQRGSQLSPRADLDIARTYLEQGLYKKAYNGYERLLKRGFYKNLSVHREYLRVLEERKTYGRALKYLEKAFKRSKEPSFLLDKMYFYELINNQKAKEKTWKRLLADLKNKTYLIPRVAEYASHRNLKKYGINLYQEGRKWKNDEALYTLPLGKLYIETRQRDDALAELVHYVSLNFDKHMPEVEEILSPLIQTDPEWRKVLDSFVSSYVSAFEAKTKFSLGRILVRTVFKLASPNSAFKTMVYFAIWGNREMQQFSRMLFWIKLGNRHGFYSVEQALDVAKEAFEVEEYESARLILDYIRSAYPESIHAEIAIYYLIRIKEVIWLDSHPVKTHRLEDLLQEYEELIRRTQAGETQWKALRRQAKLLRFYKKDYLGSRAILEKLLANPKLYPQLRGYCLLDLGDLLNLDGKPWEAILMYLRVEREMENFPEMVQLAKLKNVRSTYYQHAFQLAREQASVLKRASSSMTANDALSMSHFLRPYVKDSTGVSYQQLKKYAEAEHLIWRRDFEEAIQILEEMKGMNLHPNLQGEVGYLLAKTYTQVQEPLKALEELQAMGSDEAAFLELKILKKIDKYDLWEEKSKDFILKHKGSIYLPRVRNAYLNYREKQKNKVIRSEY